MLHLAEWSTPPWRAGYSAVFFIKDTTKLLFLFTTELTARLEFQFRPHFMPGNLIDPNHWLRRFQSVETTPHIRFHRIVFFPQDCRITNSGSSNIRWEWAILLLIISIRSSIAFLPIWYFFCITEVRGGSTKEAKGRSSNPITEILSGILSPFSFRA